MEILNNKEFTKLRMRRKERKNEVKQQINLKGNTGRKKKIKIKKKRMKK